MVVLSGHSPWEIFLENGPWGAAVVLLLYAVGKLYMRLQELHDKRLDDHRAMIERYHADVEETTKTLDAIGKAFERGRRG
jgi:hypothetical protein